MRWVFLSGLALCSIWGVSQSPPQAFYDLLPEWNATVDVRDLIPFGVDHDPIVGNLFGVPAGTFVQGSPVDEPCREPLDPGNETQFTHTLTRAVLVMETELTRQMWADLKAAQPTLPIDPTSPIHGSGMDNPVQRNTWYEAVLFANLLSVERGLGRCYYKDAGFTTPVDASNHTSGGFYCDFDANGYRLPTEGEWEYFTRAGTTEPFSIDEPNYTSGNCDSYITTPGTWPALESVAWFCANRDDPAGNNTTKPVGLKNPNPNGLRDVHGNVWEWCWDWYSLSYPSATATDYAGASSGSYRVARGGYWSVFAWSCRSANRNGLTPSSRYYALGFRLVRTYAGE